MTTEISKLCTTKIPRAERRFILFWSVKLLALAMHKLGMPLEPEELTTNIHIKKLFGFKRKKSSKRKKKGDRLTQD